MKGQFPGFANMRIPVHACTMQEQAGIPQRSMESPQSSGL
jgi:hypothetical protein